MPKAKIIDLATCVVLRRHENVLLLGKAGVSKSPIAQAIGHRACMVGFIVDTASGAMLKQLRAGVSDHVWTPVQRTFLGSAREDIPTLREQRRRRQRQRQRLTT